MVTVYLIFLVLKVAADHDFVKEIYWQLMSSPVKVGGKTRKLRVFWDRFSLIEII